MGTYIMPYKGSSSPEVIKLLVKKMLTILKDFQRKIAGQFKLTQEGILQSSTFMIKKQKMGTGEIFLNLAKVIFKNPTET